RFLGQPKGQPRMVHITRHAQAIPQYTRGHLHRVAVASQVQVRHPGLFLTGSHIDGPGVRDCVRHSTEVARKVRHFLSTGETDPGVV
ncbi:MAG: hypothetical protein GXP62_07070, partial [Oligoflexia bacterium]|nr:hypothetical protein [Oligoflexia bacterium]